MSVPPQPGQYGPPPQQPPGGPNPWVTQQPWQLGPPPKRGVAKWIFGAVALVAVIAVTATISVLVTRGSGGGANGDPSTPSSVASADDRGPVTIITEEPTCEKWKPISRSFAQRQRNGWERRDASLPATSWSPEIRDQYDAVGAAMRGAADQAMPLLNATPHRVIRELYGQFIVYSRAYADSIPTYSELDEHLARVSVNASWTIDSVCDAITKGSAGASALGSKAPLPPSNPDLPNVSNPPPFINANTQSCDEWIGVIADMDNKTADWRGIDSGISASDWTPDQKRVVNNSAVVFSSVADQLELIGRQSGNAYLEDFAVLSAEYQRAYVKSLPTYSVADAYLSSVATGALAVVNQACMAVRA